MGFTHLEIDFRYCSQLSDVSGLGAAIASLSALTHLEINFKSCYQLPEALRNCYDSREGLLKVSTALHC